MNLYKNLYKDTLIINKIQVYNANTNSIKPDWYLFLLLVPLFFLLDCIFFLQRFSYSFCLRFSFHDRVSAIKVVAFPRDTLHITKSSRSKDTAHQRAEQ